MATLFCVICRDSIPLHSTITVKQRGEQVQSHRSTAADWESDLENESENEVADYLVATPCGHMFHNNCLQQWFKVEETNHRNIFERIFVFHDSESGEHFTASRLFIQTCPYCKHVLFSGSCNKLYPIEAPNDQQQSPTTSAVVRKDDFEKMKTELSELQAKYDELQELRKAEKIAYESEVKQLNAKFENAEKEHSEVEDKWITAMRKLDSLHKTSKRFFLGIFDALGYHIPTFVFPDLVIANLIAQVLENRVINDENELDLGILANHNQSADQIQNCPVAPTDSTDNIMPSIPSYGSNLKLGDKVVWTSDGIGNYPMVGIVKWIGVLGQVWTAGVEFERAIGQDPRLIRSMRSLFSCKVGHGRLIPVVNLMLLDEFNTRSRQPVGENLRDLNFSLASESESEFDNSDRIQAMDSQESITVGPKTKKSKRFPRILRRILSWK